MPTPSEPAVEIKIKMIRAASQLFHKEGVKVRLPRAAQARQQLLALGAAA